MIKGLISMYLPSYPATLVYMLQSTEYQTKPYLKWFWRTVDFGDVAKRRVLDRTKAARLLLVALRFGMLFQILLGVIFVGLSIKRHSGTGILLGAGIFAAYPVLWAHLAVVPLLAGRYLVQIPRERKLVARSKEIFAAHPGTKIAVAGSYGKTTMKELLQTVLGHSLKVAATPGNKNVSVSHAAFASRLSGDEDVLVIEYGEGKPGDVAAFAAATQPGIGIITGVAPAHLDQYETVEAAGRDIFSLADYLQDKRVYVNGESPDARQFIKPTHLVYDTHGVEDWKISEVRVSIEHTAFTMRKGSTVLHLKSGLVGRHQVGPLSAVAALAHELGLSAKAIEAGVALTVPYEHRLQPYSLGAAWIIDDTYNGNIEGVAAGLRLLKELPAKHRRYVTPGLVDQGPENERVHIRLGELIAEADPDQVVLMNNSVTDWIQTGLKKGSFNGKVTIEKNPLQFYTNLVLFVAAGDLILMQNDWTDNYA